jgi:hypothetical protein
MNKDQFAPDPPETWWLLEADVNYQVEEGRKDLDKSFGFADALWYTKKVNLEAVHNEIEQSSTRDQLWYELSQAADPDSRKKWLGSVAQLKRPKSAPPDTGTAPATSPPPGRAAPNGEPASGSPQPQGGAAAPAAEAAPRKSIFKAKQEPQPQPAPVNTETTVKAEQIDEAVKTALSDLSGDRISSLASELGVNADQVQEMVQDPEFERMVAEEVARLAAGGA